LFEHDHADSNNDWHSFLLKPKHHPDPSQSYPLGLVRWSGQLVADLGWLGFLGQLTQPPQDYFPIFLTKPNCANGADRELCETGTAVEPVKKRFRKRLLAAWQLPWAQVAA